MQAMFGHDPPISFRSITAVRRPALAMAQARFLPASPLPMISKSNCCLSGIVSPKLRLFKSWFVDDRQPELNRLQSVDTVRDLFLNCYKPSDSVVYPDGTPVRGPKVLCELQAYAYDAWFR